MSQTNPYKIYKMTINSYKKIVRSFSFRRFPRSFKSGAYVANTTDFPLWCSATAAGGNWNGNLRRPINALWPARRVRWCTVTTWPKYVLHTCQDACLDACVHQRLLQCCCTTRYWCVHLKRINTVTPHTHAQLCMHRSYTPWRQGTWRQRQKTRSRWQVFAIWRVFCRCRHFVCRCCS